MTAGAIGLRAADHRGWYGAALLAGVGLVVACGGLGGLLYGVGPDHWYVSVAGYYRRKFDTGGPGLLGLHLSFTLPALLFRHVGEEIFFRGFLQCALQSRWTVRAGTAIETGLFALIHVCHHGLALRPASGALWAALMFGTAMVFAAPRRHGGSLGPAIVAHAIFNATMNVWIFGLLWG